MTGHVGDPRAAEMYKEMPLWNGSVFDEGRESMIYSRQQNHLDVWEFWIVH